jgi:DNA-binding LacI/PurR family transcriptional regulator
MLVNAFTSLNYSASLSTMSTISAVAKLAGVSRTTVSHVINHAHRVSGPVRDRVLVAIDHLDYVPNRQAQSLRTGRTNVVAMLIPDIANPFYPELVKVAQIELERAGLDTLIFNTDVPGGHSQEHGRQYLRQISGKRVDGLIVADFALHGIHDLLVGLDIPTVFIGHLPNHAVDSVKLDDFGGGYQLGEYLARKGHRRVAHVTGPSFFQEAMARARGFEEGFLSRGGHLGSDLRFEGSYLPASGRDAARWLVETHGHEKLGQKRCCLRSPFRQLSLPFHHKILSANTKDFPPARALEGGDQFLLLDACSSNPRRHDRRRGRRSRRVYCAPAEFGLGFVALRLSHPRDPDWVFTPRRRYSALGLGSDETL